MKELVIRRKNQKKIRAQGKMIFIDSEFQVIIQ
jgi:hypothetical protein